LKKYRFLWILLISLMIVLVSSCYSLSVDNKSKDNTNDLNLNTAEISTAPTVTPYDLPEPTNIPPVLPEGFVYIKDIIPSVTVEMRYFTENNFVGCKIDGYNANRAILTVQAAYALNNAAAALQSKGYTLLIYDAYRPAKAVEHFVRWANDLEDQAMKSVFYPDVNKENLIKYGYISQKSGHSRGSSVDLTLLDSQGKLVDMGGTFDLFSNVSHSDTDSFVTETQAANRKILRKTMEDAGFVVSVQEWWHFKLINEPYIDEYFDFDIN